MATRAHLLLGLVPHSNTSDVSSFGTFFPLPLSFRRSSLSILKPPAPRRGGGAVNVVARGEAQQHDHYGVLGLRRDASPPDIKKAFRLLARKYHPDVSRDVKSGEKFKSIRLAYEVLSDERRRSQYDRDLKLQDSKRYRDYHTKERRRSQRDRDFEFDDSKRYRDHHTNDERRRSQYDRGFEFEDSKRYRDHHTRWNDEPEIDIDDVRMMYRWAKLRQQKRYEYYRRRERASGTQEKNSSKESPYAERVPFAEVLWFTLSTLFFMHMIGSRPTLSLCTIAAFFDRSLDAGYKMGYVTALVLGGRGGIFLSICISFVSWLCGKSSSGAIALLVLAMWFSVNISRFSPLLPQGAVLVLLYMSIKLQFS